MQNKKILVGILIFIAIIIVGGLLALGAISFIVYNNFNKEIASQIEKDKIEHSSTDSSTKNEIENNIDDENENVNTDSTNKDESVSSTSPSNVTGKASSKQNPLNINEWGVSSKYMSGTYVDLPVKVTNITRGNLAAKELETYLTNNSTIYKYTEPKENMEWAIIDYSVDLTAVENKVAPALDRKVTGTGSSTSIKYNGTTYITTTINMTPNNYTKGEIVPCKFAVQLPIGCSDYLIVLGSSSSAQAFFKGN